MAWWTAITNQFPRGKRRSAAAELRLATAYRAVFSGHGTRGDAEIVLADLGNYSGFFKIVPKDATGDVLRFCEGKRSVYSRIFGFLNLTKEQLEGLHQAQRQEAITDAQEGVDWSD